MKQTPRKKITSVLLALALMLSMVALPSMAMPVQAAEIEAVTPTTFVADETGTTNTIYFGSYPQSDMGTTQPAGIENVDWVQRNDAYNMNTLTYYKIEPIKWRVLNTGSGELLLVSDQILEIKQYHNILASTTWEQSEIHTWLNGSFYNAAFSPKEQGYIASTAVVNNDNPDYPAGVGGNDTTDNIFLLSLGEVEDYTVQTGETALFSSDANRVSTISDYIAASGIASKGLAHHWWLRSAGFRNYSAAIVSDGGNVNSYGDYVNYFIGVRPAFKINLTSVIFSSSAGIGGKPTTVGANLSAATPPTAAQKLTVIDPNTSNLNLTIVDATAKTAVQGETIAIPYTGAVAGTGKFVSCVIEDSTGAIKYYAKLTNTTNGTASIELPANMPTGSYKIKMFNEQCNADNYTDFASDPIAIDLTVQAPASPTITGATSHSVATGYAAPVEIDFVVAGAPAPSFAVTSDGGTGATVTGNRLTIPTGLAANTYTITLTATNFQGSATHTVTFTVSDVISYNITVNAGVGGMATGGRSYTENSTATVVATANTGFRFKQWTENGTAVVGEGASYSFPVTAHRTLTAEFEPDGSVTATAPTINGTGAGTTSRTVTLGYSDPVDIDFALGGTPAPTLSVTSDSGAGATVTGNRLTIPTGLALGRYTIALTADNLTATKATHTVTFIVSDGSTPPISSGGRSSGSGSGGGSSKADVAPTAGTASTGKPLAKTDATKLFTTALAAKPEGATTLSIKVRNVTKVDKTVLAELAALAQKNGVTLTVHFDTTKDGKVVSRISVNPAAVTTSLDLTVKIVGGKITLPKFAVSIEVAVKMPAGMTIETLKITGDGKDITATAKPWLDKNGYVHFTTTGGEIVFTKK